MPFARPLQQFCSVCVSVCGGCMCVSKVETIGQGFSIGLLSSNTLHCICYGLWALADWIRTQPTSHKNRLSVDNIRCACVRQMFTSIEINQRFWRSKWQTSYSIIIISQSDRHIASCCTNQFSIVDRADDEAEQTLIGWMDRFATKTIKSAATDRTNHIFVSSIQLNQIVTTQSTRLDWITNEIFNKRTKRMWHSRFGLLLSDLILARIENPVAINNQQIVNILIALNGPAFSSNSTYQFAGIKIPKKGKRCLLSTDKLARTLHHTGTATVSWWMLWFTSKCGRYVCVCGADMLLGRPQKMMFMWITCVYVADYFNNWHNHSQAYISRL